MAKFIVMFVCCCIALTAASPVQQIYDYAADLDDASALPLPLLRRNARSPDVGNADFELSRDQAAVQYNQNVYSSDDGRFNVDAYAQARRDFNTDRNDFGGGIKGSFRW